MAESVIEHPGASELMAHCEREVTAVAEMDGVLCKARADMVITGGKYEGCLADLKGSTSASPGRFYRATENYMYDMQAAFYTDVFAAAGIETRAFVFIVTEKTPPYVTECWEADLDIMESGRRAYRRLLETLRKCRKTGHWPGYTDEPIALMEARPYGRMAPLHSLTMGGEGVEL
jgi:hypothetical protein